MSRETLRVFFALELPSEARERAAKAAQALRAGVPRGVRWVPPENLHLTLKFLGDVDAAQVPRLIGRAEAKLWPVPPFEVELAGLGALPSVRSARVLWLGVRKGNREMARIARKLDAAAASIGVERERRPFQAHLTLGRLRERASPGERSGIGELIAAAEFEGGPPWEVNQVSLMRSTLTPSGAIYNRLASVELKGG